VRKKNFTTNNTKETKATKERNLLKLEKNNFVAFILFVFFVVKKGRKKMMKKCFLAMVVMLAAAAVVCSTSETADATGTKITSDLWIRAVIHTEEKGNIEAVWKKGGEDKTVAGDQVFWGYFYASPSDVTWGSSQNPDLFVKVWIDHGGRIDVNFFHVSVPDIEVYSDYPYDGIPDEQDTTTMTRRYIRHYYQNDKSYTEEKNEDGNPPSGYVASGNPSGYVTIKGLKIGAIIDTEEKGAIEAIWRQGGEATTAGGHRVLWGHFYANPSDVSWGSSNNPDLFVKIWFDATGRVDVNFFHVSVPDIEIYSDLPYDGAYNKKGTTILDDRYTRHEYWIDADNQTPVIAIESKQLTAEAPFKVSLDASKSYDPDGNIVKYEWKRLDSASTYSGSTVTMEFANAGTYTVQLTITDNQGLQDDRKISITLTIPGPSSGEFEVADLLLTTETPGNNCVKPTAQTAFNESVKRVIAWVLYRNFEGGKSYSVKWYAPDGSLAQTDVGESRNSTLEGCSWFSIATAKLQEYAPGQWHVKFYYDGQEEKDASFQFTSNSWGKNFEIREFVFTKESPNQTDCVTPTAKTTFGDSDSNVTAWVYYRAFTAGDSYMFRWYSPGDILVKSFKGTFNDDKDVGGGCAWTTLTVGELQLYDSGQWRVVFEYEKQNYKKESYFTFTSNLPKPEFAVTKFLFTTDSPKTDCTEPSSSRTSFSESDTQVTAWAGFKNVEAGNKSFEFKWFNPSNTGTIADHTHKGDAQTINVGEACAWGAVTAERLKEYDPGKWRVEFYYNSKLYQTQYFDFSYQRKFEVTDFLFTDTEPSAADTESECRLSASQTSFNESKTYVFAWVKYSYFEAGKSSYFKWYNKDNELVWESQPVYRDKTVRTSCSWQSLATEKLHEYGSGNWRVEFYYDGQKYGSKEFSFTSSNPSMNFEAKEFLFTTNYECDESECEKPVSRTSFSKDDTKVIAWVHYFFYKDNKNYEFKWYTPAGIQITGTGEHNREAVRNGCSCSSLLTEDMRKYGSGQWRVEFYYDGQKSKEGTFNFTSDVSAVKFEISDFTFTTQYESSGDKDCEGPVSKVSTFNDDDEKVIAWVKYSNFETGEKKYMFKWYSPENSSEAAQINQSTLKNDLGNGCLWASIPLEKLQGYDSGTWTVKFDYDGKSYGENTFTFRSKYSDTEFDVTEFVFTKQYAEANCKSPAVAEDFTESDTEVIAWVRYRNLEQGKNYEFKWYNPNGDVIQTNTGMSKDETIKRGCTWVSIAKKELQKYPKGRWRVELCYDKGESCWNNYFNFK